MKKDKDEPQGVWDYQTVAALPPRKKFVQEKFCRSCGFELGQKKNPIGIQLFYCQPNCAFDAAVHAAAKGYAAPAYIRARHIAKRVEQAEKQGASPVSNGER